MRARCTYVAYYHNQHTTRLKIRVGLPTDHERGAAKCSLHVGRAVSGTMTDTHRADRSPGKSPAFLWRRSIISDLVQGVIVGAVLAFITFQIIAHAYVTKINGWSTINGCGEPGNGLLLRGACSAIFAGPVNAPQEAMYWTTRMDGAGQKLSGRHDYVMHFPPGGLPPNAAFWSLTMGDWKNQFVPNPINRYSVSDRSGLAANRDGSVDIYIQHAAPPGHESNWLPAPSANFLLWLRVYLPAPIIARGEYKVPPVVTTH
jgi:hypothetical protein